VSSQPGEGKSVVAANLALAMSEGGGAKVAIIDGHLLGPRLHALLLPSSEPAASDLRLRKPEIWQVTPDLCLIPACSIGDKTNRAAVENSPAFAALLQDLLSAFDYVIIDTPPLSLAADARLLLRHGGTGLLVVRARQTDLEMLGLALDRIGRHSLCGVVLNA
jgi:Mrp family chromosome partitioning ATPase